MIEIQPGDGSILPEHRAQRVAAVSGNGRGVICSASICSILARPPWRMSPSSPIGDRRSGFTMWSGCTSCCKSTAMRPCAAPSSADSQSRRSAPSTSRSISATPAQACPSIRGRPAADDSGPAPAARRPGPGRRRRPQGAERSGAPGRGRARRLTISPRRRPVMMAPDQDLDALFKRLHLANARLARPRATRRAGGVVLP